MLRTSPKERQPEIHRFFNVNTINLKTFINIKFNSMTDAKERLQKSVADIRAHYFELQRKLYGA